VIRPLIALAALAPLAAWAQDGRVVFTGDVLLARNVEREIAATGADPWARIRHVFGGADQVIGNFEGAVGTPADCSGPREAPCFAVATPRLALLKQAGFTALGLENNHNRDTGVDARAQTGAALQAIGLRGLTYEPAPWFLRLGDHTLAVVPYNEIPGIRGPGQKTPNLDLAQKIRWAHQLAELVVVYVHWGTELQDWPSERQRTTARWLIRQGADLIVGHHPHVEQGMECLEQVPVVYSLGNHVFDQKYPATKRGGLLRCNVGAEATACSSWHSETANQTAFPQRVTEDANAHAFWAQCPPRRHAALEFKGVRFAPAPQVAIQSAQELRLQLRGGVRATDYPAASVRALQAVHFSPAPADHLLLSLQLRHSSIDNTTGPRPYVYDLGPNGLVARWRGSALAWPLLDFTVLTEDGSDYLCALHRGDSFIAPNPATPQRRTQVYRWSGFGFLGLETPGLAQRCAEHYAAFTGG